MEMNSAYDMRWIRFLFARDSRPEFYLSMRKFERKRRFETRRNDVTNSNTTTITQEREESQRR